jgi:hypothetical protein
MVAEIEEKIVPDEPFSCQIVAAVVVVLVFVGIVVHVENDDAYPEN